MKVSDGVTIVLKLLAAVVNVLDSWDVKASQLIAINVNANMKTFLSCITSQETSFYTADDKTTDLLHKLTKPGVDPVILHFDGSYKAESKLRKLKNVLLAGRYAEKRIIRLPIVLMDRPMVNDELSEDLFLIDLEDVVPLGLSIWDIIPEPDLFSLIHEKISEIDTDGMSEMEVLLLSTTCFMYPHFKVQDDLETYGELQRCVHHLVEVDAQVRDSSGLAERFIKELYAYKEKNPKLGLIKLPEVSTEILALKDNFLFYDAKYVYMTSELFKRICAGFDEIISLPGLKKILVQEGILVKNSARTYTSKMMTYNQFGKMSRPDMLKFPKEEVEMLGELDIIIHFTSR